MSRNIRYSLDCYVRHPFLQSLVTGVTEEVVNPDKKVLIFVNNADSVNVLYKSILHYLAQSPNKSVRALSRRVYRLSGTLSREVSTKVNDFHKCLNRK